MNLSSFTIWEYKQVKNKYVINTLTLALLAAFNANAETEPDIQSLKINNIKKPVVKSTQINFAKWKEQQRIEQRSHSDRLIISFKDKSADTTKKLNSLLPQLERMMLSGEFLEANDNMLESIDNMQQVARASELRPKHIKKLKDGNHIISLGKSHNIQNVNKYISLLKKDPSIESVEVDHKRFLYSQNQPWGIANTQSDLLSDANASGMTVCIIDSGYQQSNPDLNANNASGTNDSGTGNWYQAGGSHGTHVAGTIAAVNNSEGVVGVMPNTQVNLHIVKVFNASGWGYSSDLADAVDTCVNNGAKVVNMSLGGAGSTNVEKNALQAAANSGVLLVAASGNDGNSTLSYPASYDSVMAVGAVDQSGKHAEFSQYTSQIEVAAPGEAILSTVAGDGRLGSITAGSNTYANDEVVPQTRYVESGGSFSVSNVNGSAQGSLQSCTLSGGSYTCSSAVSGNICLAERNGNQKGSNYPEIDPALACMNAGASGVIIYGDTDRPGLQNPFLVDASSNISVPTVSVNRALGLSLLGQTGAATTLSVTGNQDYAYYNGTSMATPHVAGVAALVWSNNANCSADDVRSALKSTAIDLETSGRDDKTGYGLVQAKAASDSLSSSCGGTTPPPPSGNTLTNGVAKTGLAAASGTTLSYTLEVPAGASNLTFDMSGGTGDADVYVKFGSVPTSTSYDCRPYKTGNNESCAISNVQAGTYYVNVTAYSTFSGVSLTGSFDESGSGGGATGGSSIVENISVSRRAWKYYTIDVPAGMSTLDFAISGGTGDADLYIRKGAQPTSSTYDCRPYKNGNAESCSFNNPGADTWHIGIYGYSRVTGLTLNVNYNP